MGAQAKFANKPDKHGLQPPGRFQSAPPARIVARPSCHPPTAEYRLRREDGRFGGAGGFFVETNRDWQMLQRQGRKAFAIILMSQTTDQRPRVMVDKRKYRR